jgi:DNA-binding XRE family transcriptional regulator
MNDVYDNIENKKSREEYTMLSKYRIKELRYKANISQDKLSEVIGVSRTQIIRWEKITKDNDTVIDSIYKNRMCRYFNIPLRKLYNCEYKEFVIMAKKDAVNIMKNTPEESRGELTNITDSLSELMTQVSTNTECTEDTLDLIENKLYEIVKLGKYDIFVLFDFLSERKLQKKALSSEITEEIKAFLSCF